MVWSKRLVFLVLPLFITLNAHATRLQFAAGDKAEVRAYTVHSKSRGVKPVEIKLSVPALDVNEGLDGFQTLNVPGLSPNQEQGSPAVAVTGSLIVVPEGYTPELTIVSQEQQEVRDVLVQPFQQRFRCGGHQDSFSFNSSLYQSRGFFPAQVAALEEVGKIQDVHLMRVALNPIQQDFAKNSVQVTTDLHVRVDFKATGRMGSVTVPKTIAQLIAATTVNGADVAEVGTAMAPELLLVIVADNYKSTIAPYVRWKRQRGYDVQVVTFTEAGGTKDAVKTYIQKFYDAATVKPSFMLFVGNNTTMPTHVTTAGGQQAYGDYTYALLAGADEIPDVTFGRLTGDNEAELKTQIDRWIAYEKEAKTTDAWYPQAMTIASSEKGAGPSDIEYSQQIQAALKGGTFTAFDDIFEKTALSSREEISKRIEQGRSWVTYIGHGTGKSWYNVGTSLKKEYFVEDVDKLTNAGLLPNIIDVACQNGNWVKFPKVFGKAWVTREHNGQAAGAVSFYGGSVNISWDPPAIMSVGVAKTHYEKGVNVLGTNVLAGQLYLMANHGKLKEVVDNMKWYNLLGDPALSMRTAVPRIIKVSVASSDAERMKVSVVDENGKALSDVTATIERESRGILAVAKTDANGEASIALGSLGSLAESTLTVGGYNTVVYQQKLQ